jgi:hypothetical protein
MDRLDRYGCANVGFPACNPCLERSEFRFLRPVCLHRCKYLCDLKASACSLFHLHANDRETTDVKPHKKYYEITVSIGAGTTVQSKRRAECSRGQNKAEYIRTEQNMI